MKKSWEGKVVVIAEDELVNFLLLQSTLKFTNVKIIWAKSGFEAICICKDQKVDIVLMDVKMPDIDGLEATAEIKRYLPELPIIAQTSYAAEEDKSASLEAGCNDYISKPIQSNVLLNKMSKYIGQY